MFTEITYKQAFQTKTNFVGGGVTPGKVSYMIYQVQGKPTIVIDFVKLKKVYLASYIDIVGDIIEFIKSKKDKNENNVMHDSKE